MPVRCARGVGGRLLARRRASAGQFSAGKCSAGEATCSPGETGATDAPHGRSAAAYGLRIGRSNKHIQHSINDRAGTVIPAGLKAGRLEGSRYSADRKLRIEGKHDVAGWPIQATRQFQSGAFRNQPAVSADIGRAGHASPLQVCIYPRPLQTRDDPIKVPALHRRRWNQYRQRESDDLGDK